MLLSFEKNSKVFLKVVVLTVSLFSMALPADSAKVTTPANKSGFSIKGSNNFELQLKGYGQMTGYSGVADKNKVYTDQFLIRRARLETRVMLGSNVQMRIHGELASSPQILDVYLQLNMLDQLNLQLGIFKSPLSMERLQPVTALLFSDFAYTASIAPNRDIGIQLSGKSFGGILKYQAAVVNGSQDGSSSSGDLDDSKDVAGRVLLLPFAKDKKNIFNSFGIGLGGSYGMHEGEALSSFRTSGRTKIFNYKSNCLSDGRMYRVAPQIQWFSGKFSLISEYIQNQFKIADTNGLKSDLSNYAWTVSSGLIILNGTRTEKGYSTDKPFCIEKKYPGGFELVARTHAIEFDKETFRGFASSTSSVRSVLSLEGGINWLVNDNARIHISYCTSQFKGGAANGNRADEKVITFTTDMFF